MKTQPKHGRELRVPRRPLGLESIGRVDEEGNVGRRGDHLVKQLQPLRPDLHIQ